MLDLQKRFEKLCRKLRKLQYSRTKKISSYWNCNVLQGNALNNILSSETELSCFIHIEWNWKAIQNRFLKDQVNSLRTKKLYFEISIRKYKASTYLVQLPLGFLYDG